MATKTTVKTARKHMGDLHFEHTMWTNALTFYKEELIIFTHRLEEVLARNTKPEATADGEKFQNQIIRQGEVIDTLLHEINAHENGLVKFAKEHPVAIDHRYFDDHTELHDKMDTFNKLWTEFRADYLRFLTVWM